MWFLYLLRWQASNQNKNPPLSLFFLSLSFSTLVLNLVVALFSLCFDLLLTVFFPSLCRHFLSFWIWFSHSLINLTWKFIILFWLMSKIYFSLSFSAFCFTFSLFFCYPLFSSWAFGVLRQGQVDQIFFVWQKREEEREGGKVRGKDWEREGGREGGGDDAMWKSRAKRKRRGRRQIRKRQKIEQARNVTRNDSKLYIFTVH